MRMAFGLVSVLVTLGVIIMIMTHITLPNIKQGGVAKKKTEETLGALTSSGLQDSKDSIALDPVNKGGRFEALKVRGIAPGGAMQMHYGLMNNDVIVGVAGNTFDATANGDQELAESLVWEARGRQQSLMVLRNGRRIELPWQPLPEEPDGPGANAAGGEAGEGAPVRRESPLSRQVRIATH